ncbi:MAG TPA: hypothetical protein VFN78_11710 [Ktedonobacterales bacterium]|nr:hypothetical protein [Ktedonobacterales bacterium]
MSQRTRARTTGAAASPTNHADQAPDDNASAPATGTARRARRVAAVPEAAPSTPPASSTSPSPALPMQPDALARALRAVATELERDPALAERVAQAINEPAAASASGAAYTGREPARPPIIERKPPAEVAEEPPAATIGRSFRPTIVTGIAEELGPGVPDPFALRERLGEDGLREALASLRLGSLRAIVRQHNLDPSGSLGKLNDAEKLREKILAATRKRRS